MKIHSTGDIDFKPWWTGLHLCCPDCGSIYELEENDADCDKWHDGLDFSCNRCGHKIYAERHLIETLRRSVFNNFRLFELHVDDLPLKEWGYIQKYLNPAGFKREESDIDGCLYDVSKLGYCGNVLKNRDKL